MTITIESTTKIVDLETRDGGRMPARIWEGTTASGIPVHVFVTRIAVHKDEDHTQFVAELQEHKPPSNRIDGVYETRLFLD
jgi:hypothetical protein